MAKVILIGYDGPGSGANVVKCLHFTDADEANKYRQQDTECYRFLTVRNPAGVRKQNENYKRPSQEMPEAGSEAHTLVPEGSTPSPATPSEPQEQGAGETGDTPEAPAPSDSPAAKKPPGRIK